MPHLNHDQQKALRRHAWDCPRPPEFVGHIQELRRDHEAAFELLREAFLRLDGTRVFNILEECRLRHGRIVRERAFTVLTGWRDGRPGFADEASSCLLSLLPRHLTLPEKLHLLSALRQAEIASLPRTCIEVAVMHGADISAVVTRVLKLLRRTEAIPIPARLLALQGWLGAADERMLHALAAETEHFIGVQRLAALMVHLAALARMRGLAAPQFAVSVRVTFQIPTATIRLRVHPRFWRADGADANADLLVHLQEMALREPMGQAHSDFAASALRGLSPGNREKLRLLAAGEGLGAERLLRELQMLTEAARADMETTAAAAQEMMRRNLRGKVVSEHSAAFCTRIEIRRGCAVQNLLWLCTETLRDTWRRGGLKDGGEDGAA